MPKIVDHEKYKRELVAQAVPVFRAHGYSAVGMREIASELKISKSALYHYFPTKKQLFDACCGWVTHPATAGAGSTATPVPTASDVRDLITQTDAVFRDDLRLLLDYSRTLGPGEIGDDPNLRAAFAPHRAMFHARWGVVVGEKALRYTTGALMLRALGDDRVTLDDIHQYLSELQPVS